MFMTTKKSLFKQATLKKSENTQKLSVKTFNTPYYKEC